MGRLTLKADGRAYEGWTSARVTRDLRAAAAVFEIEVTERWPGQEQPWPLRPGQVCTIELDGETVLTGHVDIYAPSHAASAHAVRVTGRSRTADLIDCSALVPGGQFKKYGLAAIARALAQPFGIDVTVEADAGAAFADVQVQQGESCFELIERLCRVRALLASDGARGDLVLTRAGAGSVPRAERLRRGSGGNILVGSARLSHATRYSEYRVKGQQAGTDQIFGAAAAAPSARVSDPGVTRFRPRLVIAEAQADAAAMRERARWEAKVSAAEGTEARITVAGWRQSGGALWTVNALAHVEDAWLGLDRDLLIAAVTWIADEQSSRTEMVLVPPAALTPQPASDDSGTPSRGNQWADVI